MLYFSFNARQSSSFKTSTRVSQKSFSKCEIECLIIGGIFRRILMSNFAKKKIRKIIKTSLIFFLCRNLCVTNYLFVIAVVIGQWGKRNLDHT
jgi:hypothetical protein